MTPGNRANATSGASAEARDDFDPDRAPAPAFVLDAWFPAGSGTPHAHDRHQLVYAREGVLSVESEAGRWVVPPLRAVWIPAHVRHRVRARRPYKLCSLYVSTRLRRSLPGRCCVVEVAPLLRELLMAAASAGDAHHRGSPTWRMLVVALDQIAGLPVVPLSLPSLTDARAQRVAAGLLADPSDRRTLAEWGARYGAGTRMLERSFKADTGLTFSQWRTQLRLLTALELLGEGRAVTQVALDVGYEDASSFIAMFRSSLGVTPARYFDRLQPRRLR